MIQTLARKYVPYSDGQVAGLCYWSLEDTSEKTGQVTPLAIAAGLLLGSGFAGKALENFIDSTRPRFSAELGLLVAGEKDTVLFKFGRGPLKVEHSNSVSIPQVVLNSLLASHTPPKHLSFTVVDVEAQGSVLVVAGMADSAVWEEPKTDTGFHVRIPDSGDIPGLPTAAQLAQGMRALLKHPPAKQLVSLVVEETWMSSTIAIQAACEDEAYVAAFFRIVNFLPRPERVAFFSAVRRGPECLRKRTEAFLVENSTLGKMAGWLKLAYGVWGVLLLIGLIGLTQDIEPPYSHSWSENLFIFGGFIGGFCVAPLALFLLAVRFCGWFFGCRWYERQLELFRRGVPR